MAVASIDKIQVVGNVAYIPLTQGKKAIIDLDDVPIVSGFSWWINAHKKSTYAIRSVRISPNVWSTIYMHRLIMNAPDNLQVDHISGDGLDNRRSNMRLVTIAQNRRNQRINNRNSSGFKGVSFHAQSGKWRAMIGHLGTMRHIGLFECPVDAHIAYCKESKRLHGEYGRRG